MILYYIKIAFRNYLNNKTQSLITLFSLAFAFAFASLATFWNNYEKTYDSFLTNYENIYLVGRQQLGDRYISKYSTYGLNSHLMNQYAEVEKSCGIKKEWDDDRIIEINNRTVQASCEEITPETIDIFDVQWIAGNRNIESWNENEVAISEETARKVCGKDSPIGLSLNLKDENGKETESEYKIVAVFKTWPKHSNFDFHIIKKLKPLDGGAFHTYVCLKPNTDINQFLQKMIDNPFQKDYVYGIIYNVLTPLKELHYTFPENKRNISLNDVKLFTGASIILVLCALLNYLNLFISRLCTNKGREMALRTICGSSSWQLGMLLMVEYILLMLGSLFFSIIFIELFYNEFVELSQLEIDRFTIYVGCAYLLLFILALAALLSLVPIFYFKKKTLRLQIDTTPVSLGKNSFRITGVCVQLFISILFIFCSSIMIKQVHYLIHADIQIERKNIASITSGIGDERIMDILRQIPLITEMVPTINPLFPENNIHVGSFKFLENKDDQTYPAYNVFINQDIADFYGLKVKEGSESFDLGFDEYFINETFAKQLNDPNLIGKTLWYGRPGTIRGIVYDYQFQPPTEPVRALVFQKDYARRKNAVAFKYIGDFTTCQAAIKEAFEKADINSKYYLNDGETIYKSYLTSEFNLLKLLSIITVISLLIALFGVYTLILQECERQRKNIAIRKVYGAQVKDILMMFFKKYVMQVVIASAFAFPIGYVLIKHWLEGYSRQTSMEIEVFLGIFICMALLVSLCIGWHVWRAANENPATVVKKE